MSKVVEGLYYAKTHEWLKVEGDVALIGITDYAQDSLGDVVFVDLPSVGDSFDKEDSFGAVESVKAASDLMMPVGGEVIEVNEELNDAPELLNEDPYANFIIKIKVNDLDELNDLLDAKAYEELTK
ncbi:TPA: glycine cleavage system protein GcvH [bacterium]|jgi:glycine cleavage system H protein|nr:glycine cleavage system protein GcvH [bacterium]